MKAIRVHTPGEADVMVYEEIATPEPKAGEARVRIEAVGLNFIDIYQRRGWYPLDAPFTPGMEAAGVVDAVGPDVTDVAVGDRVAYTMQAGAYAEAAIVPAWKLAPLPDAISMETAAAVMLQGLTAHYLTRSTFPLQPGNIALVHAAAGGVGLLLVQMAKQCGARVIGTVSTEEKAALARAAGADDVILYSEVDFADAVVDLVGAHALDVVYDSVGQSTFDKGLDLLKPRGYMVLFGQASGPVAPLDPQVLNQKGSLFLTRPSLGHYVLNREELLQRCNDLFNWLENGTLHVRIDQTFALADAPDAHRCMEARKTKGKVVLVP
ncbi:MAG: quinone oxidoreductase [Caldilineaceae bacterium]